MPWLAVKCFRLLIVCCGVASLIALSPKSSAAPEQWNEPTPLDPTAAITSPVLESQIHQPLPEQYIWSSKGAQAGQEKASWFRSSFNLSEKPQRATLYVAGPEQVTVTLNDELIGNFKQDPSSKLHPFVFWLDVSQRLLGGRNVLALQVMGGDRLAAKVVPRGPEEFAPALLLSGPDWKFSTDLQTGWERPDFDDSNWKPVVALGGIESNIDFFQWNSDANMYRWPGYDGISPFLARLPLPAGKVTDTFEGLGHFDHVEALTSPADFVQSSASEFAVTLPTGLVPREEHPSLVLDFGREIDGRLQVVSDSDAPLRVRISYGESMGETLHEPYLGADEVLVPAQATAYGPKSSFRYARVEFLQGSSPLRFKSIRLDAIYYPVKYEGSFESSDPLLNRIWTVGAYTAHLCMQDDIWDAPKRDRGRWMGDLDVSGRVIDSVFADHFLMQDTMDHLIHEAGSPVNSDVNGINGYSAFWVMGEADYYRHFADLGYLRSIHDPLVQLLSYMEGALDQRNLFAKPRTSWPYVDWSPDMNENTAEVRRATQLEYYKAFSDGAWLLRQEGDKASAARFQAKADAMKAAAQKYLLDPSTDTFGLRHQTNAMAIFSGVADAAQTKAIWQHVLSQPRHFMISPYYNFYVITAMAQAGHRRETLDEIRNYWGGMVKEGATSTWEAYDPTWPKDDFHRSLQSDNGQGYFVSLAHGWSSGPTDWLMEQVLGIQPLEPGFREVSIRPDLVDLQWARGAEPTPQGLIRVDLRKAAKGLEAEIDLPQGLVGKVSMPVSAGETTVMVNGKPMKGSPVENGSRLLLQLTQGGHYQFESASK
jgi:hypothetical protein